MNTNPRTPPTLAIVPRRSAVLEGHSTVIDVLVKVVAPDAPAELPPRPPLNLGIVVDRSGSMSGAPLTEAVRAARMMIEALGEGDRVSFATFDHTVDLRVRNRPALPRGEVLAALEGIASGGSTALFSGWERTAQDLVGAARTGVLSRVLLLTDGRANLGKTSSVEIAAECGAMAAKGVSTSTYGVGRDFDEDLLAAMARAGRGRAYYGERAVDLEDPFREELSLLQAMFTPELRLSIRFAEGFTGEVLNGYVRDGDGLWVLPSLAYGGEAWALVRVRGPAPRPGESQRVLTAEAFGVARDGEPCRTDAASLRLPALPAAVFGALAEDPEVVRRAEEVRAAELQDQARLAAHASDWRRVDELLATARREAGGNAWVGAVLKELESLASRREQEGFAKLSKYSAERSRNRLARKDEGADFDLAAEASMPAFLRKKAHEGRTLDPRDDEDAPF